MGNINTLFDFLFWARQNAPCIEVHEKADETLKSLSLHDDTEVA